MIRILFSEGDLFEGDEVMICDSETLHHLKVVRAEPGERIDVLMLGGKVLKGNLISLEDRLARVKVFEVADLPEGRVKTAIACALVSANRFDELVGFCAEFGISRLIPMITKRTVARLSEGTLKERWLRKARQVCRTTGNPFVPEISGVMDFVRVLDEFSRRKSRIYIPHLSAGSRDLLEDLVPLKRSCDYDWILVVIGPEGDFTPEEVELAREKGAIEVTLGRFVLRVETAVGYCAGLLSWVAG